MHGAIAEGAKADAYREVGARATPAYKDAGGRAMHGAIAEGAKAGGLGSYTVKCNLDPCRSRLPRANPNIGRAAMPGNWIWNCHPFQE